MVFPPIEWQPTIPLGIQLGHQEPAYHGRYVEISITAHTARL